MRFVPQLAVLAVSSLALTACGGTGGGSTDSRDFVRVVGSSTVYPFATAVAEAENTFAQASAVGSHCLRAVLHRCKRAVQPLAVSAVLALKGQLPKRVAGSGRNSAVVASPEVVRR